MAIDIGPHHPSGNEGESCELPLTHLDASLASECGLIELTKGNIPQHGSTIHPATNGPVTGLAVSAHPAHPVICIDLHPVICILLEAFHDPQLLDVCHL